MVDTEYTYRSTTALRKIKEGLRKHRVLAVQGGQGAAKTISILQLIIDTSERLSEREITVFGSELTKMKTTVIRDFIKIIKDYGFYTDENWNKTSSINTFDNGSYVEFMGLDQDDLGKGMRRDIVYFNEGNRGITLEAFTQITSRAKRVIIDYNPDAEFFIHDMIANGEAGIVVLDYRDNEFLPQTEIDAILNYKKKGFINPDLKKYDDKANIKSDYWANKWRVYGQGKKGLLEGQIFTNYEIIDDLPAKAKRLIRGLDFGYTNDPSSLTSIYYLDGFYIIDEDFYATGLSNADILSLIVDKRVLTVADSAEPKSIAELKKGGLNIIACTKGSDSVRYGIDIMQTIKIKITKRSVNVLAEFKNYTWKKDKSGRALNVPIDEWNHAIDGSRYGFSELLGKTKSKGLRVI